MIPDQTRSLGGLPLASTAFHGWLLSLSRLFPSFASFPGVSIPAFLNFVGRPFFARFDKFR